MSHAPRGLNAGNAPSPNLVFTWLIFGVASFVLLSFWLATHFRELELFFASPRLIALVHVAVLGWINGIIFAVLFQFMPVALNVPLSGGRLAWWQFYLYVPGAAGMIVCFWIERLDWPLHSFATLLFAGLALFVWNVFRACFRLRHWTLAALCIVTATAHLLITALLGLFLSAHIYYPMGGIPHLLLLKAHAHTGMAGWLLLIVMGVGLKILPMFALSSGYRQWPAWTAFALVNAGLLLWAPATVMRPELPVGAAGIVLLLAGVSAFVYQVYLIYRARARTEVQGRERIRRPRALDFQLRFAGAAFLLLPVVAVAGAVAAFTEGNLPGGMHNRVVIAYGLLIFLGFFSLLTQAILYRIAPVLIWIRRFSNTRETNRPPTIKEMTPKRSCVAQLLLYCTGAVLTVSGVFFAAALLAGAGTAFMAASSLWLAGNLITMHRRTVQSTQQTPTLQADPGKR